MSYKIELQNFEGPMDLLLYFIKRDELNIYDIPITHITREFMLVIKKWEEMKISIAGEFIVMASTLMRIKVKMMLPKKLNDEDGQIMDPREELVLQLMEYKKYHAAANYLAKLSKTRGRYFTRPLPIDEDTIQAEPNHLLDSEISLFEIAKAFKNLVEKKIVSEELKFDKEPLNLENQKKYIISLFDEKGKLLFKDLIKNLVSRFEIILTFLAVLDLIKDKVCSVLQNTIYGKIELSLLKS